MPVDTTRFTFRKEERLTSRIIISKLFTEGKEIFAAPFRLVWMQTPLSSPSPVQIAFSVPVKKMRHAVDRNRIKRQMREVYRLNKSSLYSFLKKEQKQYALMIIFIGQAKPHFAEVEKKLKLTLLRFEEDVKKYTE